MRYPSSSPPPPRDGLPLTRQAIEGGRQVGLHIGAQLYVARGGQVVADLGLGEARPGVPMTADTIMLWLSAGKPIGAAAIMQLAERGQLDLHDAVARFIPEFSRNGKEAITLRHLLIHTGGFRWVDIGAPGAPWGEIIEQICGAKIERDWTPGERAGYHPFSSWYILGEVVRRVDGRSFSQYVREEIFLPLGMVDSWIGMSAEQFAAYGQRMGVLMSFEKAEPARHRYSQPAGATACVPGGNGHGPMHDLGRFYQMLLGDGELQGKRILSRHSVRQMTSRQRVGLFDETFRHVMDWGLGLIIDSNRYGAETVTYGYGRFSSPRTFGHGGSQSSVGFADPDRQLVVALVFNGMPGDRKHDARLRTVLAALYTDLGLASQGNSG